MPSLEHTLGVRRHSVPVNMEPTLPRTIYRRESLPTGRATSQSGRSTVSPIRTESRTSSGLKEEDELLKYGSQASLLSTSSGHHHSSGFNNHSIINIMTNINTVTTETLKLLSFNQLLSNILCCSE